jgi:hypothetical protein
MNEPKAILKKLVVSGYSLTEIEFAFHLPTRTLSRWKHTKNISASGEALLKVLNVYPWIIDAAKNNFESADEKLMEQGFKTLLKTVKNAKDKV